MKCQAARRTSGMFALKPEELRRFHLGRDAAADIVAGRHAARVDLRACRRAVVHPDDDVARRVAGRARRRAASLRRQRPPASRWRRSRSRRSSPAPAPDAPRRPRARSRRRPARCRRSTARRCRRARARAMSAPGGGKEPARRVEHAGARAAGADVDARNHAAIDADAASGMQQVTRSV